MAAKPQIFKKEILRVGQFKKAGQTINVRPEDLELAVQQHSRLKSKGYSEPLIFEHASQFDASGFPAIKSQMSDREKLKFQAGWNHDLKVENGSLFAFIEPKTSEAKKLIKEVGTYVSPQFGKWKDPDTGEDMPMTITHIALTPRPVDAKQDANFYEVSEPLIEAAQLSHLVSFSMADYVKPKPDEDVDKNNDGVVDGEKPGAPGSAGPDSGDVPEKEPDGDEVADQVKPGSGDTQVWPQITAALKMMGAILPQDVNPIDNPQALLTALMTCAHHTQKADATAAAANAPDPNQQVQNQVNGGQDPRLQGTRQEQVFTMSQTATPVAKTSATPQTPAMPDLMTLPEFVQLSNSNKALEDRLNRHERNALNARIDGILADGKCDKPTADKWKQVASTYQLSNESSTDMIKLQAQLELAESLPRGAVWSGVERQQQMSVAEENVPDFFRNANDPSGGMSDEEIEKELDRMHGKLPGVK